MRQTRLAVLVSLTLAAGACAPAAPPPPPPAPSPERAQREAVLARLIEPCQRRFPAVRATFDDNGRLHLEASGSGAPADVAAFRQCVLGEAKRVLNVTDAALAEGRLRPGPERATARIELMGPAIAVWAEVNGIPARLLLDTGATHTVLSPRLAQRAGVAPGPGAPKIMSSVVGGRVFAMPYVRLATLRVGSAVVEGIEVGVFDALPHLPAMEGLLGAGFLNHFKVTIDREARLLTLEPSRAGAAVIATSAQPAREWRAPVWLAGDEWRMRWRSPSGSGTYVHRVEGEETIDDVAHYVVSSGTARLYYVKATLGWHLEKAGADVVTRRTPPLAYAWPLRVGKTWESQYRRESPRTGRSQDFVRRCAAADEPTLSVSAGTFTTIHIVCRDSQDRVVLEAWWADEAKHAVQERVVTAQGERVDELVAYSVRRAP